MIEIRYLVISPGPRLRVAKRPQIAADEIAIRLKLNFPDRWGKVVGDIEINVPDLLPADVEVVEQP